MSQDVGETEGAAPASDLCWNSTCFTARKVPGSSSRSRSNASSSGESTRCGRLKSPACHRLWTCSPGHRHAAAPGELCDVGVRFTGREPFLGPVRPPPAGVGEGVWGFRRRWIPAVAVAGETELTVQLVAVCVLPNFTKFKMQSERLSDLLTRVNKKVRKSRHCICSRWVANTAQSPGREVKFSRQCNQPLAKPHPPPFTCPGKSPV